MLNPRFVSEMASFDVACIPTFVVAQLVQHHHYLRPVQLYLLLPATSLTSILNPRFVVYMVCYDAAGGTPTSATALPVPKACAAIARHVIDMHF